MTKLSIPFPEKEMTLSALLQQPEQAKALLVLAHGAGAGMDHPFLNVLASDLAGRQIATLRFQFPYMELGKRRPDSPKVAKAAILAAIKEAEQLNLGIPLLVGGKSFGGRMASQLLAEKDIPSIKGLVFFGFPLHAPGKPSKDRAAHLPEIQQPMLFLQGTRDSLAKVTLITEVCKELPTAHLKILEGADHSFKMLKRSGKTQEEMIRKLAELTVNWLP